MTIPRLASDIPLHPGAMLPLTPAQHHYLLHVLRLKPGDALRLFHADSGEFSARIHHLTKREGSLVLVKQVRPPKLSPDLWVCFAPVKGGRTETILEKITELGARVIQPVLTRRAVVDKLNPERAMATIREAAEQCERLDVPELRPMLPLANLLADWPKDRPLFYGDEAGGGETFSPTMLRGVAHAACLIGPEGGFAPEEFAMLRHCPFARPVGLGPRILRSDTAAIILTALLIAESGDWHEPPRFGAPE